MQSHTQAKTGLSSSQPETRGPAITSQSSSVWTKLAQVAACAGPPWPAPPALSHGGAVTGGSSDEQATTRAKGTRAMVAAKIVRIDRPFARGDCRWDTVAPR